MRILWLVILVGLLCPSLWAGDAVKTVDSVDSLGHGNLYQLWADAHPAIWNPPQFLNDEICLANALQLFGCVKAANFILTNEDVSKNVKSKDSYLLSTRNWFDHLQSVFKGVKNSSVSYFIAKDWGDYIIIRMHEEFSGSVAGPGSASTADDANSASGDQEDVESLTIERKFLKDEVESWASQFVKLKQQPFPTAKVVALAREIGSLTDENKSYKIASSFDSYRQTAVDAHARWEPYSVLKEEQSRGALTNQTVLNNENRILVSMDRHGNNPIKVGYFKLRDFLEADSCSAVKKAVLDFLGSGVRGLILDLRNNYGGNIQEAVCIAGLFTGPGKLIVEIRPTDIPSGATAKRVVYPPRDGEKISADDFNGKWTEYYTGSDKIVNVPSVVLINSQSASASEIVAGALQDYQMSLIVGARSFGKATAQAGEMLGMMVDFKTVARFYLPGNSLVPRYTTQLVGVVPDLKVPSSPGSWALDEAQFREADYSPIRLESRDFRAPSYPQVTKYYEKCISKRGSALRQYNHSPKGKADFQLLTSLDALHCSK